MASESQETSVEEVAKTYSDNENPVNKEIKEWDTQPMEVSEFNEVRCENTYIDEQISDSDSILNNPMECAEAFQSDGPLGLFLQFVPPVFMDTYMRTATQAILDSNKSIRGKKIVLSVAKMHCVIGLDIAMSYATLPPLIQFHLLRNR